MNRTSLGAFAALFALASTSACSNAATLSAPRASDTSLASIHDDAPCHLRGRPEVLTRHAFAAAGVEVVGRTGGFEVRFATGASRCFAVERPATSRGFVQAPCPSPRVANGPDAGNSLEGTSTGSPRGYGDVARFLLGVAAFDTPRAYVGFHAGEPDLGTAVRSPLGDASLGDGTELVAIGGERFLMIGVEAGYTAGGRANRRLRAQPIASWGEVVGASFALSPPEASVIGAPSVAIGPGGEGLAAYVASVGEEVDVVATSFACAVR